MTLIHFAFPDDGFLQRKRDFKPYNKRVRPFTGDRIFYVNKFDLSLILNICFFHFQATDLSLIYKTFKFNINVQCC